MSGFSEAVDLVKAKFDDLRPGVVETFLVGEKFLGEQRAPNDVVWVNPGGAFTPHRGAGPEFLDDGTAVSPMLMDDMASFSCFTWGTDEDNAKEIMVEIIRSMDQVWGWDNYDLEGYVAVTEEEEHGGYVWEGFAYALRGSIRLGMTRETIGTVEITSDTTTGEYE